MAKIRLAKAKIRRIAAEDGTSHLHPNALDSLFQHAGPGYAQIVDRITSDILWPAVTTAEAIAIIIGVNFSYRDPLMQILSGASADEDMWRNLPKELRQRIKPWMLIEPRTMMTHAVIRRLPPEERQFIHRLQHDLIGLDGEMNWGQFTARMRAIPLLILAADQDPFIPFNLAKSWFNSLDPRPWHHLESIEQGDHSSSIRDFAADYAAEKIRELVVTRHEACESALLGPGHSDGG